MPKGKARQGRDSKGLVPSGRISDVPPAAPQNVISSPMPEELSTIWDDDIAKAFQDLRPQHQDFLLTYLRTGNSAEAYRQNYNKLASDHLAAVAGSRLVSSVGIGGILEKFMQQKTHALFVVVGGYSDMAKATKPEWVEDKDGQWENVGDVPDWQARDKALIGLSKIHGLNAPEVHKHTGEVKQKHSGAITLNIDTKDIQDVLNGRPE